MSALALAPSRRPAAVAYAVPAARPSRAPLLLLPPILEPRPDPAEPALAIAAVLARSVLGPVIERTWPVAPAQDRPELPDPAKVAGAVALAALEVLVGVRPVAQLARWVSPAVLDQVGARVGLAGPPRRATVRSTRAELCDDRAAEASVVLHDGARCRAAALRLEVHRGRWRATVLQIG